MAARRSLPSPGSRHLGSLVSAYVDRSMPPELLRACDRHLVACAMCRAAADGERRLLSSLRGALTPGVPSSLEASLLGLCRTGTVAVGPAPLGLVGRDAPPMHRSPARAAMLAGLAVGASAAAAWGIAVVGPPVTPPATTAHLGVTPVVARTPVASTTGIPGAVTVVDTLPLRPPAPATTPTGGAVRVPIRGNPLRWAESHHD